MKTILAPLVTSARGRFGGSVFSVWKGVTLVRRFASPSNPQSTTQVQVRNIMRNLTRIYIQLSTEWRATWESYAVGKPLIGRNVMIARNVAGLKGQANYANFVPAPGDASCVPPGGATFTAGIGQITIAVTEPAVPTGWVITGAIGACIKDLDPDAVQTWSDCRPYEGIDLTSPFSIVISGLTLAQPYRCSAWLKWLAPDGTTRYSTAITGTATPT